MSEIVFLVEEDPDGGLTARALGESIFTEARTAAGTIVTSSFMGL